MPCKGIPSIDWFKKLRDQTYNEFETQSIRMLCPMMDGYCFLFFVATLASQFKQTDSFIGQRSYVRRCHCLRIIFEYSCSATYCSH